MQAGGGKKFANEQLRNKQTFLKKQECSVPSLWKFLVKAGACGGEILFIGELVMKSSKYWSHKTRSIFQDGGRKESNIVSVCSEFEACLISI